MTRHLQSRLGVPPKRLVQPEHDRGLARAPSRRRRPELVVFAPFDGLEYDVRSAFDDKERFGRDERMGRVREMSH